MRCRLTLRWQQSNFEMAFSVATRMEDPLGSDGIHPVIPYHNTIFSLIFWWSLDYTQSTIILMIQMGQKDGCKCNTVCMRTTAAWFCRIQRVLKMTDGDSQTVELHFHIDLRSHQHIIGLKVCVRHRHTHFLTLYSHCLCLTEKDFIIKKMVSEGVGSFVCSKKCDALKVKRSNWLICLILIRVFYIRHAIV